MDQHVSNDIPLGLGMALAQNLEAMNRFSALPPNKKKQIINHAHNIESKAEMHDYVTQIQNQTITE